ncbi:cupin domain-containing protein [Candidatus Bathyarchaeota archaeon]|nr:MAG: cupin domain-containing protein [Candidatus Bathyarchaeota archaeon]
MKIIKREDAPTLETVKGRHGEILMAGEKCMMMINTIEPGIPTPPHSHPHEQIGYLIEGKGILYIDGETQEIEAQATFLVPPHADHNFDAKGDKPAVLIEAFAPPREDYIARIEKDE